MQALVWGGPARGRGLHLVGAKLSQGAEAEDEGPAVDGDLELPPAVAGVVQKSGLFAGVVALAHVRRAFVISQLVVPGQTDTLSMQGLGDGLGQTARGGEVELPLVVDLEGLHGSLLVCRATPGPGHTARA